jgi:uncharacterized membrane protein
MRWYPIVTFWQVTADLAVAASAPPGHGHHYDDFARNWCQITPPDDWTAKDTDRLSGHLAVEVVHR